MVGHQAVAQPLEFVELHMLAQKVEINGAFLVGSKKEMARIAALRDMLRNIIYCGTGEGLV